MLTPLQFTSINLRNGIYQGEVTKSSSSPSSPSPSLQPQGQGIFFDLDFRITIGTWHQGRLNGNTLIFQSHSRYLYGSWENGEMEGVNVYRDGDNVVVGNYVNGEIKGEIGVIFEGQKVMMVFKVGSGSGKGMRREKELPVLVKKYENVTAESVKQILESIITSSSVDTYLNLPQYLSKSFTSCRHIHLQHYNDITYIGLHPDANTTPSTLGIVFNDNNFIYKIGSLNREKEAVGIGGVYNFNESKEGDFEIDDVVMFRESRSEEVRGIMKRHLLRGFGWQNQYFESGAGGAMRGIGEILGKAVMGLGQNKLEQRGGGKYVMSGHEGNVNDKIRNENLKKMRAELYLSIGRPGSQIKPVKPEIVREFIQTEDKQKRVKKQTISNKTSITIGGKQNSHKSPIQRSRKPSGYNLTSSIDPYSNSTAEIFSKYELQSYKRPSVSPLKSHPQPVNNSHHLQSQSKTKSNFTKYDNLSSMSYARQIQKEGETPSWIRDGQAMIRNQTRLSRSPVGTGSGINNPTLQRQNQLKSLYSMKNTVTFGNSSVKKQISELQKSNIKQSNKSKYLIQQQESPRQLLNLRHHSSPPKLGKSQSPGSAYGSPYKNINEDENQHHMKSTEIKTISRRMDKPEILPRSSSKYNYIGDLEVGE